MQSSRHATDAEAQDKSYRVYAAASFALIMIVVGVPIWWKTTTAYRAPLPVDRIEAPRQFVLPVAVRLLWLDAQSEPLASTAADLLQRRLTNWAAGWQSNLRWSFRVDAQQLGVGRLKSEELRVDVVVRWQNETAPSCRLGSERDVHVSAAEAAPLAETLAELLIGSLLDADVIHQIVRRSQKELAKPTVADDSKRLRERHVWLPAVKTRHAVDVYLLNPRPQDCDTRTKLHAGAVARRLAPFFKALEPVVQVSVSSQSLYYVNLPMRLLDRQDRGYGISPSAFPHIISPLERHLSSVEPDAPVLNVLVLVAPPPLNPLAVLADDGLAAPHNGFAMAGWGGLSVWNDAANCSAPLSAVPDAVVTSALAQLRLLFGLGSSRLPPHCTKAPAPLAAWELQRAALHATVNNALTAAATLRSLASLLDEISNIVISDDVAAQVVGAVDALDAVVAALAAEDLLDALAASKRALRDAEGAFFHPSLLALLYFPDDQKYAIYVPLFLPVGVPVVWSLRFVFNHFCGRPSKSKVE